MLFLDSSFYIVPTWFLFISLSVGTILGLAALVGILFLAGVSTPIILYMLASIFVISLTGFGVLFVLLLFSSPMVLGTAGLFILIPYIMWLSIPNTDSEDNGGTFADYLKNVYSTEVINSDNLCVQGSDQC
jgi:hypothetical protein